MGFIYYFFVFFFILFRFRMFFVNILDIIGCMWFSSFCWGNIGCLFFIGGGDGG